MVRLCCVVQGWRQWWRRRGYANLRATISRVCALVTQIVGISARQRGLAVAFAGDFAVAAFAQSTVFEISPITN
uniref:Uncharacterized protein n=1 Tax=Cucumis sativus TaxID=3659 RepID=A0A0A0KLL1_CUCSA